MRRRRDASGSTTMARQALASALQTYRACSEKGADTSRAVPARRRAFPPGRPRSPARPARGCARSVCQIHDFQALLDQGGVWRQTAPLEIRTGSYPQARSAAPQQRARPACSPQAVAGERSLHAEDHVAIALGRFAASCTRSMNSAHDGLGRCSSQAANLRDIRASSAREPRSWPCPRRSSRRSRSSRRQPTEGHRRDRPRRRKDRAAALLGARNPACAAAPYVERGLRRGSDSVSSNPPRRSARRGRRRIRSRFSGGRRRTPARPRRRGLLTRP